jgi:hypothetical protein
MARSMCRFTPSDRACHDHSVTAIVRVPSASRLQRTQRLIRHRLILVGLAFLRSTRAAWRRGPQRLATG